MFIEYNPNPIGGRRVGDCAVRAVAKALGKTWERAYVLLAEAGYRMGDMPSSNAVIGNVLRNNGFKKAVIPNGCPDCYTASDFCEDNPIGTFVLLFDGHIACVVNGSIWDSWNSSDEIPILVWYKDVEPKEPK